VPLSKLSSLHPKDQEGLDSFLHRNTKTEISNFEGSFRPCLFSRIDSSSSFESSFENFAENFEDCVKEERPLSKSYKPESVLKASFITEERNSPSFREFENSITHKNNFEPSMDTLTSPYLSEKDSGLYGPGDIFKYRKTQEFNSSNIDEKTAQNDFTNISDTKLYHPADLQEKNFNLHEKVVKISAVQSKNTAVTEYGENYLKFIDIVNKKDEEIKSLTQKIIKKEEEIQDYIQKNEVMQNIMNTYTQEKKKFVETIEKLQQKLEKCENQLTSARTAHFELQKEANKMMSKANKEDRIRKIPEDYQVKDRNDAKLKECISENEYLKQELQKRPSTSQYQASISRIEELEGIISKRSSSKGDKDSAIIKSITEYLKLDNPLNILPAIKSFNHHKSSLKLLARISALIKDCVPAGTYKHDPSPRDMWKFIRNVMEGYIKLKKNENSIVISKLQGILGIGDNGSVMEEVIKIYDSLHFMELLFDKIKAKLGLAPHATLKDVETAMEYI
jgi:hypothetical protein